MRFQQLLPWAFWAIVPAWATGQHPQLFESCVFREPSPRPTGWKTLPGLPDAGGGEEPEQDECLAVVETLKRLREGLIRGIQAAERPAHPGAVDSDLLFRAVRAGDLKAVKAVVVSDAFDELTPPPELLGESEAKGYDPFGLPPHLDPGSNPVATAVAAWKSQYPAGPGGHRPFLVAARDEFGLTALDHAVVAGRREIVEVLDFRSRIYARLGEGHRMRLIVVYRDQDPSDGPEISPLHLAAMEGRGGILEDLLRRAQSRGPTGPGDPAPRDRRGLTPLAYAIAFGKEEAVATLLKSDPQVAAPAQPGIPLILIAAQGGDPRLLGLLRSAGARLDVKDASGNTVLHHAAAGGQADTVRASLGAGRVPVDARNTAGRTSLHVAARRGRAEAVAVLLAAGADAGAQDGASRTPLLEALVAGDPASALAILEKSGSSACTTADQRGRQPLHAAAAAGNAALVRVLLDAGADPRAKGPDGVTPLHLASACRGAPAADAVRHLLERGAKAEDRDDLGRTALHFAAMADAAPAADVLLDAGAPVDAISAPARDEVRTWFAQGDTILALEPPTREVREFFAVSSARLWGAKTPLHLAAAVDSPEVAALLLADVAEADGRDEASLTPLMLSVVFKAARVRDLLLRRRRIDVNAVGPSGTTPLDLAGIVQDRSAVQALRKRRARSGSGRG